MWQFLIFASIGVWNTLFDIVLWKSLLFFKVPQKSGLKINPIVLAQYISVVVASCVSFGLNLFLTFGSQKYANLTFVVFKFILATAFFAWFSGLVLGFLQAKFPKLKPIIIKLVTIVFVFPLTYFAYKFVVYS